LIFGTVFAMLALGSAATALAPVPAAAGPMPEEARLDSERNAVEAALQQSAAAWSRGDLNAFMHCYEDAPQTAYVSAKGVVHGYGAIHDMYAARFAGAAPGSLGKLSLSVLDYRRLGPDFALVTGRFFLDRRATGAGEASGVFTLVFHRTADGWRIVSDHTA
jgi:uncharacterized protein (TIGR02246 family)